MSIEIAYKVANSVPARNLLKVMYDRELIAQLAQQIIATQVEAHIDMAHDFGDEYKTHTEAAAMLEGARMSAEDYVDDLISEFNDQLRIAMSEVKIIVKKTSFSSEGFEDAEVLVE